MFNKKRGVIFGILFLFLFIIGTLNFVSASACMDDSDCPQSYCLDTCTIKDYYCSESFCALSTTNCPCSDGVCVTRTEICNGVDDDCDGNIDADDSDLECCIDSDCSTNQYCSYETCHSCDSDGDGYSATRCGGTDCSDSYSDTYLGAPEICDGRDNDCDGTADEGTGECISTQVDVSCEGNIYCSGYNSITCPTSFGCSLNYGECTKCVIPLSCNEFPCGECAEVSASTEAECNTNCVCLSDEHACTCNFVYYDEAKCFGFPTCEENSGCYTQSENLFGCYWYWPVGECGVNLDLASCNSAADCGWECCDYVTCYIDSDGDNFGDQFEDPNDFVQSYCSGTCPNDHVTNRLDCDDSDSSIKPGEDEICDGVDNDCNGLIDNAESQIECCADSDCETDNYCSEEYCFPLAGSCSICNNDADCVSGLSCINDNTGQRRCEDILSDSCLFYNDKLGCEEVKNGNSICFDIDNSLSCSSGTFSAISCDSSCNDLTGECFIPEAYWIDVNTLVNQSLKTIVIRTEQLPHNINLILADSGLTSGTFAIKEDDSGEGLINLDDPITSVITSTVSDNKLIATWSITQTDLDAAGAEDDGIYEFYFEVSDETSLNVFIQPIFTVPTCSDGEWNGFEEGIDCGGECDSACDDPALCLDGNLNGLETEIDCGGPYCPACASASWTNPYSGTYMDYIEVDADDIPGGITFRMVLNQPANTGDLEFALKESDDGEGLLNYDDSIETFTGVLGAGGDIEFNWTTTLANFEDAGDEDGNLYEFYFEIQGKRSNDLEIQLDSVLPSCSDDIKNGDEVDVDCGGSCPDQDCVSVCFTKNVCADYQTLGDCNADECEIAANSVPNLGEGETASCEWISGSCNTKTVITFNRIEIGNCIYDEDITTDNCDDGYLSYSWAALWDWGNNRYGTQIICETANEGGICVEDGGEWHYDPNLANNDCVPGEQTIPCPAQIQLNFFTWKNFFAAALLILIIYIILRNSRVIKKVKKKTVALKGVPPKSKVGGKKKTANKKRVVKKKVSNKKK